MRSKYAWARSTGWVPLCLLFAMCLMLSGCFFISKADEEFAKVQGLLESTPLQLDGEEVMLSDSEVQCGVQAELWDMTRLGQTRSIARLNQSARDLHFYDDVIIGEPGTPLPHAQIRGTFQLRLQELSNIRDENPKSKLAEARVGVEIPHPCFRDPLPQLMGVRRGRFTQEAWPLIHLRVDGDNWIYDRVQH